jgi:hypothetical protein
MKAIEKIEKMNPNPTRLLDPEADLILAIRAVRQQTPIPSTLRWMKGHTDDKIPYDDLDPDYKTQVDMDHLAKHSRTHDPITYNTPFPGSKAMLILDNNWVTTAYNEQIQDRQPPKRHTVNTYPRTTPALIYRRLQLYRLQKHRHCPTTPITAPHFAYIQIYERVAQRRAPKDQDGTRWTLPLLRRTR